MNMKNSIFYVVPEVMVVFSEFHFYDDCRNEHKRIKEEVTLFCVCNESVSLS